MRSVVLALSFVLLSACAHQETAADRQISEMRDQISRMQVDNDRFDKRLGELEVSTADSRSPPPPGAPRTPPRTVQLGASGDRLDNDDPNDATDRPEIKVAGGGGGVRSRPVKSSINDPDAKKSYESALKLVSDKQYDKALDAFAAFLVKYPDHPFVENANYWRGESYFAKGEYKSACDQFEAVLARPSGGGKAPDALLKLGIANEKLGATDKSNEFYARLRTEYPKSEAAKKIPSSTSTTKGPR